MANLSTRVGTTSTTVGSIAPVLAPISLAYTEEPTSSREQTPEEPAPERHAQALCGHVLAAAPLLLESLAIGREALTGVLHRALANRRAASGHNPPWRASRRAAAGE